MARILAVVAAVWAVAFALVYVAIARRPENNGPAWWYVVLVAVGAVLALASTALPPRRALLIAAAVVLGVAVLAGLLSVGALLFPAVVVCLVAAVRPGSQRADT